MIKEETIRHWPSRRVGLVLLALAALLVASFLLAAKPAHASTIFTVTNTNDSGDGSLRKAIEDANATSEADTINFNIPGSGVHTIKPNSELPAIIHRLTIDGYSQGSATADTSDDATPNTADVGTNAALKIELDGTNAGQFADGLQIDAGGSGSVVKGLVVNRFRVVGIRTTLNSTQNRIEGNFIGTDPSGTVVDLGNRSDGVNLFGSTFNTVGGSRPDQRNLISGNFGDGVTIDQQANFSRVEGNLIGTDKDGTGRLGNFGAGALIEGASNSTLSSNTIAFNGGDGIAIREVLGNENVKGNLLAGNSIFSNVQQGIDLGGDDVTQNDSGDGDTGPNDLQNFPVISSAKTTKKGTTITGTLNSTPNSTFLVQFFSSPEADSSGFGEGQKSIGQVGVSTDSSGNASFTFKPSKKVGKGQKITATAINTASSTSLNTSEFSAAKKVVRKR